MKISSTDVLMKSYLDVRLQSLKVTGWSWLSWLTMTANLSIILTYISPPKAAWAGGPVVCGYRLRWSNYTAEACLTVEWVIAVCLQTLKRPGRWPSSVVGCRNCAPIVQTDGVWRHSVNVIYFAKLGYSVSMLSYQLCYNNFLLLFSFRTGQNIQKHYIK